MATIALEGLKFFAYHGVYAVEMQNGNDFEVDIWLDLGDALPTDSDEISLALDYCEVYAEVNKVMTTERVNLLETLLVRIGKALLAGFPGVQVARVRVSKLNPAVGGPCARTYLEQEFRNT